MCGFCMRIPSWMSPLTFYISLLFVALMAIFTTFPEIDLKFSELFFSKELGGFYLSQLAWVQISYVFFAKLGMFLVLIYLIWIILSFFPNDPNRWMVQRRKLIYFLLTVLLIGPGVVTHNIFKDNWGRARPHKTSMFEGSAMFTPAWKMSDQCHLNCSFLSGHAAIGYYPLCLYFLLGKRRRYAYWLGIGLAFGLISGMGRVLQGKHFLSDILFSFFIVYFTSLICFEIFLAKKAKLVNTRAKLRSILSLVMKSIIKILTFNRLTQDSR